MSILEQVDPTVMGEVERVSDTEAAEEEALTESVRVEKTPQSSADPREIPPEIMKVFAEGWRDVINEPLIDWGKDPSQLEDEGIEAPSRALITFVSEYAMCLRRFGWPPPLRVVPSGDGGIVFELKSGPYFQSLEFDKDGTVELVTFKDSKFVTRIELPGTIPE